MYSDDLKNELIKLKESYADRISSYKECLAVLKSLQHDNNYEKCANDNLVKMIQLIETDLQHSNKVILEIIHNIDSNRLIVESVLHAMRMIKGDSNGQINQT